MIKIKTLALISLGAVIHSVAFAQQDKKTPESTEIWEPQPRIITPGIATNTAPSDAIILFDGKNLESWVSTEGNGVAAPWAVKDGTFTVVPGTKDIKTKLTFGDVQLHVEWRTPTDFDHSKTSQGRSNSGIFLQERYEVQVLDNFENKTYANGQAGSIYKQHIPLVNACKKPGEWQTYDIIFVAARFNKEGRVLIPAKVTVLHNGVLVQNNVSLSGPTEYIGLPIDSQHDKASIRLQDHGNSISFRNIWVREI